jgi:endonuclease/exonuclease/phosphatase family metal-dependent hydrolase
MILLAAGVPVGLLVSRPSVPSVRTRGPALRLVDYNIHSAVGLDDRLDPERIADVIESQRPDVVVLEEVGRGWAISGTTDLGQWLARRLAMHFVWSPAADHQFGNALLTRLPILHATSVSLPQGPGRMVRSYVRAEIQLAGNRTLTVIGTHLQDGNNRATRIREIDKLLRGWNHAHPSVIVGDMNAEPETPEIERFLHAGLESPQKTAGSCRLPTSNGHCVDWVFGTPDVTLQGLRVIRSNASDHTALAVSVRLQSHPV